MPNDPTSSAPGPSDESLNDPRSVDGPFAQVGERFQRGVSFSLAETRAFAEASGDFNPLHHDPEVAARSRFGGPIISGTQLSSAMMGMTATHFSRTTSMLGLEFSFRFAKAVRVDEAVEIEWVVTRVRSRKGGRGDLVDLRGVLRDAAGEEAVTAKGLALVLPAGGV